MNESTKYPRLQELSASIQLQMERLKAGELSLEELEIVVNQSRELYERLVVLRYKAFDESVNGITVAATNQGVTAAVNTVEESKPELTNQVSLIDAIAEVSKTEDVVEELPLFTMDTTIAETPVTNTLFDLAALPATPSVNEMLARTMVQQETVAQHHTNTPIADLKIAITLNQRFQFSRELFKGNNQDYEVAIDLLNTSSREDSMQYIKSLEAKYQWSTGSSVVRDFCMLVERRHQ
jgi:biotin synthase-related radical SAM superfamily protein